MNTTNRRLRICYVLSYRAPDYIRTRSLLSALGSMPDIETRTAINSSAGPKRYQETLTALSDIARKDWADIYILGFRGHEIYWPVRMVVGNKPIIFDAMMSPYAALREEGKHGLIGSISAGIIKVLERSILQNANAILTDTTIHAEYFSKEFGIPATKISPIPVGAVESVTPKKEHSTHSRSEMSLLFYGSFLPLHGAEVIVSAANLLQDLPLRFDFIGGGIAAAKALSNGFPTSETLHYTHRAWVAFDELIQECIPAADLCLGGPFGNTPQARRVVTGKTSQCMAAGKPTIIGATDNAYGFIDKKNCLLVEQGNPASLAEAIRWAYQHQEALAQIGASARDLYQNQLSIQRISEGLRDVISRLG